MNRGGYKRPFDLAIMLLAHMALVPLFLLAWLLVPLLIKLSDRGPVFFRQPRTGQQGKPFDMLKFRTMVVEADQSGPAWTAPDDERITWFGRILRRTAIDEIPSLVSIWKGEMSLVGPRALSVEEQRMLEETIPGFEQRLQVRPGLTGLSQVYNRADDASEKLRLDLQYIERMSPWLDAKLLLLSVTNSLLGRWDRRTGKTGDGSPAIGAVPPQEGINPREP